MVVLLLLPLLYTLHTRGGESHDLMRTLTPPQTVDHELHGPQAPQSAEKYQLTFR